MEAQRIRTGGGRGTRTANGGTASQGRWRKRDQDSHGGTANQGRWRKGPGRMQTGIKREEEILREEREKLGLEGELQRRKEGARAM